MKKVLILNKGDLLESLNITALVKRFQSDNSDITIASDNASIFEYCGCSTVNFGSVKSLHFDIAINTSPSFTCSNLMGSISSEEKYGYGQDEEGILFYNKGAEHHYRAKFVKIPTSANQFQLLFDLSGIKWKGEGYNIKYFPRNKARKGIGLAIKNVSLRQNLEENLDISKIQKIPIKQNILKQFDEINRCSNIVTDDFAIAGIALSLRKKVEILTKVRTAYRFETFGAGEIHILRS
jgi:hypothetical protein